jgi:hypothetical protein
MGLKVVGVKGGAAETDRSFAWSHQGGEELDAGSGRQTAHSSLFGKQRRVWLPMLWRPFFDTPSNYA